MTGKEFDKMFSEALDASENSISPTEEDAMIIATLESYENDTVFLRSENKTENTPKIQFICPWSHGADVCNDCGDCHLWKKPPFDEDGLWNSELSEPYDMTEPEPESSECPVCGATLDTRIVGDIRLVAGELFDDTREVTECPACGWIKEDAEEEF